MKTTSSHLIGRLGAIWSIARRAYSPYRGRIVVLAILSLLGGLLEGIGVNAVIPLLSYLVEANGPAGDTITSVMRALFAFLHIDFAPKYLLFFIVVMFILRGVVMFVVAYVQAIIAAEYARATKSSLFRSILYSSWPHLMEQRLGRLETVLLTDVPSSESLLRHIATAITLGTGIVVYLAVAFTISPTIMMVTLALGASIVVASKPLLYRIRKLATERIRINQDTTHLVSENILGMKTVKAFGVESRLQLRGGALFESFRDIYIKLTLTQQVTQFLIPPLGVLYIALIFGIAFRTEFISMAALPAIFYLIYRVFLYVQQIQDSLQRVNDLVPHLQSVLTFMDESQEAQESTSGAEPFVFNHEFKFEGVAYKYEGTEQDAIQNISFTIPHGSLTGIIGPSGAGKTTCVDLILRLLTPTSGALTLDGVDVGTISLAVWRKKIAYVSQDIFLMHDTIANNIRFYDETISDDAVRDAVRMSHLDDVVAQSSEGLNAPVGERGLKLSAGQRQRIAIARALARNPAILVLDEATSALDAESESHIKRIFDELKGNVTIITIAHRLSTIKGADHLIVLEKGQISESGSPANLLTDKDSYFFKVNSIV